jgi:O-methyltransferase
MLSFQTANLLLNRPNNMVDGSIISIDQVRILLSLLEHAIKDNIDGDIVEFGCYVGESSKYFRMMLDYHRSDKELYVYDSFEGLPELSKYEEGTGWRSGTLVTTEHILAQNFINNGLRPPIVHKGWFKNVPENNIPNKITFAFLDGDFYDSIYDSLQKVFNRVSQFGIICFHDYERADLPGVKAAVDDYISHNNLQSQDYLLFKIWDQIGVMIKLS